MKTTKLELDKKEIEFIIAQLEIRHIQVAKDAETNEQHLKDFTEISKLINKLAEVL